MAAEDIGSLYNTKMPGYEDAADIQAALKLFLYGSTAYDTANTDPTQLPNPSLARHLQDLSDAITTLEDQGLGSLYTATEPTSPQDGLIWVDSDAVPTYVSTGSSQYLDYDTGTNDLQNIDDGVVLKHSDGTTDLEGSVTVTTGFTKTIVELHGRLSPVTTDGEDVYLLVQRSTDGGSTWTDIKSLQATSIEENNAGNYISLWGPFMIKLLDTHGVSAGSSVSYRFVNNTATINGTSANTIRQWFDNTSSLLIVQEVA